MFRMVPAFRGRKDLLSTAWVTHIIPLMFVLFMMRMSATFSSANGEGAPRARHRRNDTMSELSRLSFLIKISASPISWIDDYMAALTAS